MEKTGLKKRTFWVGYDNQKQRVVIRTSITALMNAGTFNDYHAEKAVSLQAIIDRYKAKYTIG